MTTFVGSTEYTALVRRALARPPKDGEPRDVVSLVVAQFVEEAGERLERLEERVGLAEAAVEAA